MDRGSTEEATTTDPDASIFAAPLACFRDSLALACSGVAFLLLFLALLVACVVLLRRVGRLEDRVLRGVRAVGSVNGAGAHRAGTQHGPGILRDATAAAMRQGLSSAVLLAGLDRFETVIGGHGPCAADEALAALGSRLSAITAGTWVRVGGDLFALALPADHGPGQAEATALAVLRSLAPSIPVPERSLDCTASLGVAVVPRDARDIDGGLRAAHAALARARTDGGNRLRVFDAARDGARLLRDELAGELRDAIGAGAIVPHYQPIVDLRSGSLVGLEVLARWWHPQRGVLTPDAFMSAAEEARLSGRITEILMRRAVLDARVWPSRLFFAFNISPQQLGEAVGTGTRDLPSWPEWTLDPARLEIEVTECGAIEDLEAARRGFAAWQERGTRIVLDDFGIGISNLARLRDLRFDKVKIDKGFLMGTRTDARADACVRAMLELGARLCVDMVAEGLTDADSASHVAALGCRYGQGYLYSAPVPAGDVPALVRRIAPPRPAELIA